MYRQALISGVLFAALGVMLGAFAAHGLDALLPPEKILVFQKGVTYQFYHSFGLLFLGIIYSAYPANNIKTATTFFVLGILFFSGSLYLFPLLEVKNIEIPHIARLITPLGGLCFIIGWLMSLTVLIKKK